MTNLSRRMRHLSRILDQFWSRWKNEYLTELRSSHRYPGFKQKVARQIKSGDAVIIEDEVMPRGYWRLGVVETLLVGRDEEVRAATVRTHSKPIVLKRPIQKLYPLEVRTEESVSTVSTNKSSISNSRESVPSSSEAPCVRPRRIAAERAKERFKSWAQDLISDT